MSRLIDGERLIENLRKYRHETVSVDGLEALIAQMPTVEPKKGKWIPVSERLPEAECGESESVLVCFENGTQDVLYFNGGNWCYPTGETYISRNYKNGWHNEVVAWMPLPEQFQRGKVWCE